MCGADLHPGQEMNRIQTLQDLFRRYRRPGDFFIAMLSFLFALFLLVSLPFQTTWIDRSKLFAQPAFWPAISIFGMAVFSGLHMLGAILSERLPGRMAEVMVWIRSLEYAVWFLGYVALVPVAGYLPATLIFTVLMTLRLGYRGWRWMLAAVIFAVVVVLLFKGFLRVNIPAGAWYEQLPEGAVRNFIMTTL